MWFDFCGSSTRTSTPRRAAASSAPTKSESGMKYAWVSHTLRVARLIASMYIDRIGNIHNRGTLRCTRIRGVRRADVVAAHERHVVVDHEDLAVVATVATQVEEAQPCCVDREPEHAHRRGGLQETGGDEQGRE